MLGLDKMQWQALHISFMMVFTFVGLIHIWLNIKPIKAYLKNRARKMVFFLTSPKKALHALPIGIH